jgi:hypothetical protein
MPLSARYVLIQLEIEPHRTSQYSTAFFIQLPYLVIDASEMFLSFREQVTYLPNGNGHHT